MTKLGVTPPTDHFDVNCIRLDLAYVETLRYSDYCRPLSVHISVGDFIILDMFIEYVDGTFRHTCHYVKTVHRLSIKHLYSVQAAVIAVTTRVPFFL